MASPLVAARAGAITADALVDFSPLDRIRIDGRRSLLALARAPAKLKRLLKVIQIGAE